MGTFNAIKASYAKLRSGDWGVRIEARINTKPLPGDEVLVRKASGETKTETVGAVVWSGGGVFLCSIRRSEASQPRRSSRAWRPCGYPGCNPGYCDECDGEGARGSYGDY